VGSLRERRDADLKALADWCMVVLRFKKKSFPPELMGIISDMEKGVQRAQSEGNLRGLRAVVGDLKEWSGELTPQERNELDNALRHEVGWGLLEEQASSDRVLKGIVANGKISSATEYRLVTERVDALVQAASRARELAKLQKLLQDFHESNRRGK
jgi:hypothetical protein